MNFFKSITGFFRARYIGLVEYLTAVLMFLVNKMMRHLIILNGKDPDTVPDILKKRYPKIDPDKTAKVLNKFWSSPRTSIMTDGSWVKDVSKHPVLQSRAAFQARSANPPSLSLEDDLQVSSEEIVQNFKASEEK